MKTIAMILCVILSSSQLMAKPLSKEVHINVKGMVCAFCVNGLTKTFKKQPEVENVHVSLEKKSVHLEIKEGQVMDSDKIINLIKEAGYEGVIQD